MLEEPVLELEETELLVEVRRGRLSDCSIEGPDRVDVSAKEKCVE